MYHLPIPPYPNFHTDIKNPHYAVVGCFEPANAGGYPPEYFTFPLNGGLCAILRVQIPYVKMLAQNYTDSHAHSRAAPVFQFYNTTAIFDFQLIQFTITAAGNCYGLIILILQPKNASACMAIVFSGQFLLQPCPVKTNYKFITDSNYRYGHYPSFHKLFSRLGILLNILFLELHAFLRKKLLRGDAVGSCSRCINNYLFHLVPPLFIDRLLINRIPTIVKI